jgi:hypothetical protein
MKKLVALIMVVGCFRTGAQEVAQPAREKVSQPKVEKVAPMHPVQWKHAVTATVAVGFVDYYRQHYDMPTGFEKNNTSGFVPIYGRLEYGLSEHWGLAATFGYDGFVYNYNQLYEGYNGIIRRYKTDNFRLYSGGLAAYYHFKKIGSRLHPFMGGGLALNNIRHSALPQGDSTVVSVTHTICPVLKAGARYFISDQFSVYADAGYDKQTIFSVGFSCMFYRKKCETVK